MTSVPCWMASSITVPRERTKPVRLSKRALWEIACMRTLCFFRKPRLTRSHARRAATPVAKVMHAPSNFSWERTSARRSIAERSRDMTAPSSRVCCLLKKSSNRGIPHWSCSMTGFSSSSDPTATSTAATP